MSGCGSPRYMAPEVLNSDAYNMKADVYTFSIILWEMLSGYTPYIMAKSKRQLVDYIIGEKGRPAIEKDWPPPIKSMLRSSFDADIDTRPTIASWYGVIRKVLASMQGCDKENLGDSCLSRRRGSFESF